MKESLGKDKELLALLLEGPVILDGQLLEVKLFHEGEKFCVALKILPRPETLKGILELVFEDVTLASYFNDQGLPYYISNQKIFFTEDNQFYFSADPYLENQKEDERDNDVVKGKKIIGFLNPETK